MEGVVGLGTCFTCIEYTAGYLVQNTCYNDRHVLAAKISCRNSREFIVNMFIIQCTHACKMVVPVEILHCSYPLVYMSWLHLRSVQSRNHSCK